MNKVYVVEMRQGGDRGTWGMVSIYEKRKLATEAVSDLRENGPKSDFVPIDYRFIEQPVFR